ncbi:MAG: hypothetical protein DRQ55_13680 [Planctomycetota bacterium]|nr:MAG: hypothetical protein DRQ55_13680 [Planctomycetota bacterium]
MQQSKALWLGLALASIAASVSGQMPMGGGLAPGSQLLLPGGRADELSASIEYGMAGTEKVTMVTMRDGVRLWTKVYLPDDVSPDGVPTILHRSPYRFPESFDYREMKARFYASRGYAYVMQDCRGRFKSEGEFDPFVDEVPDGQDTSEWVLQQPWSNGRIGAMGGSYDGFTALAAAVDNPYMTMVVADDTAYELSAFLRPGGRVNLEFSIGWLDFLQGATFPSSSTASFITNSFPLAPLDTLILGGTDAYWQQFVSTPDPAGAFYDERTLPMEGICAPVLSIKSADDQVHWDGPVDIWTELLAKGCPEQLDNHHLIITPDGHHEHSELVFEANTYVSQFILAFIDRWLGEQPIDFSTIPPVLYSAPTDPSYQGAEAWPPGNTVESFYLGAPASAASLGAIHEAASDVVPAVFTVDVDPASMNPCSEDYPAVYFLSEPVAEPLYIAGSPELHIRATIDTPDADFSLRLYEWKASQGVLTEITRGGARARYRNGLDAPEPVLSSETLAFPIRMWSRAYELAAGSQLLLSLSSGDCWFAENPNTGVALDEQQASLPVQYRYLFSPSDPIRLELPSLP